MDDHHIRPAELFPNALERAAGSCHAMLAVMGRDWATIRGDDGRPRLQDPDDWVRREIETALQRDGVVVIPVVVGGGRVPDPDELPESLRPLTDRQAQHLNEQSFDHDFRRLLGALPRPSVTAVAIACLVTAFIAALIVTELVTLAPAPQDQSSEAAGIAVAVARRTATWAFIGAAIAGSIMIAAGRCPHALSRTLAGLGFGALAGAAGGLVDSLPSILNIEEAGWDRPAAFGLTGALIGALLGGMWGHGHKALGLALGAGAGLLAEAAISTPATSWEVAIRATLLVALILFGLAVVDVVARYVAEARRQPGARLSRPRFP
jgi:TIR domain